jgi:hypothetical protein
MARRAYCFFWVTNMADLVLFNQENLVLWASSESNGSTVEWLRGSKKQYSEYKSQEFTFGSIDFVQSTERSDIQSILLSDFIFRKSGVRSNRPKVGGGAGSWMLAPDSCGPHDRSASPISGGYQSGAHWTRISTLIVFAMPENEASVNLFIRAYARFKLFGGGCLFV